MSELVIIAEFDVKPGAWDAFLAAALVDAEASVRDEPGCRQFDVLTPDEGGDTVVLYEIYDDDSAFAAHLRTPHFAAFRDAIADLEEKRQVGKYRPRNNKP